jgi:uncharacterized protein (DUF2252 family)
MSQNDIVTRITAFNRDAHSRAVRRKYKCMADDPFAFFRATANLFYEDLDDALPDAPIAWCSGDAHLENFGTFKADNGLTFFDINDFDQAALLPLSWELARMATSIVAAGASHHLKSDDRTSAVRAFLTTYATTLATGRALWLERANAQGAVRQLLRRLRNRTQSQLLSERTELTGKQRTLRIDDKRTRELSSKQSRRVRSLIRTAAHDDPLIANLSPIDAVFRIAGLASLGFDRFIVLARDRDGARKYSLLDIKEARSSVAAAQYPTRQLHWKSEAERIVSTQRIMQAASPAFLTTASSGTISYVIRTLQPTEDRLEVSDILKRRSTFRDVIETTAHVMAWSHLRSAGHNGSAAVKDLQSFAIRRGWIRLIETFAIRYGAQVERDFLEFATAWQAKNVPLPPSG